MESRKHSDRSNRTQIAREQVRQAAAEKARRRDAHTAALARVRELFTKERERALAQQAITSNPFQDIPESSHPEPSPASPCPKVPSVYANADDLPYGGAIEVTF